MNLAQVVTLKRLSAATFFPLQKTIENYYASKKPKLNSCTTQVRKITTIKKTRYGTKTFEFKNSFFVEHAEIPNMKRR